METMESKPLALANGWGNPRINAPPNFVLQRDIQSEDVVIHTSHSSDDFSYGRQPSFARDRCSSDNNSFSSYYHPPYIQKPPTQGALQHASPLPRGCNWWLTTMYFLLLAPKWGSQHQWNVFSSHQGGAQVLNIESGNHIPIPPLLISMSQSTKSHK